MCGIEVMTMRAAISVRRVLAGREKELRPMQLVDRVLPLQGGGDRYGPGSQGVALGWRVVAPLARSAGTPQPFGRRNNDMLQSISQPEGLQLVSPGQRPGNSSAHTFIRPERAIPDLPQSLESAGSTGCSPLRTAPTTLSARWRILTYGPEVTGNIEIRNLVHP